MSERAKWRIAPLGIVLAGLLALSTVPLVGFYQHYWSELRSLPQIVVFREAREGGRWAPVSRISPWMTRALIATEDRTFYSNVGISFDGIGRSLLVDLKTGQLTQGGSTLTQQLVRDTLLSPQKTFRRKVSEALLAIMLTTMYSKREILALYLNEVYLGDGAYGVYAASEHYFGVSPQRLTLAEAALIAGLPQAPSAYDPLLHLRLAKMRQWEVLESMVASHDMTLATAHRIYKERLPLKERAH